MSTPRFSGLGLRILTLTGLNAGLLTISTFVNPFITLAGMAALAIIAMSFVSELGFVIITILISHVTDIGGIDFEVIRVTKWAAVSLALVFVAWQLMIRKDLDWPKAGVIEKYFAIYILWGLICLFFAKSPVDSIFEFTRQLSLYVVYLIARITVRNRRHVTIILTLLALVVAVSSLYSISGMLFGAYYRFRGFMSNANNFGNTLAVVLPFVAAAAAIARNRMIKHLVFAVVILGSIAIVFSWSRGAITTLIIEAILFLFIQRRFRLLLLIGTIPIIVAAILALSPSLRDDLYTLSRLQGGTTHRTLLWSEGLKSIPESPIFGQGFHLSVSDVVDRIYWNDVSAEMIFHDQSARFFAHNHYIQSLMATGIPGLLIFLWILYALVRDAASSHKANSGKRSQIFYSVLITINCGFIYSSIFGGAEFLGSGTSANYYWIILGMLHAIRDKQIEL